MEKKVKYIFFDSRKTAFELVVLNTRFYWERILLIGCQYVNKQSLDFIYCLDRIFEAVFLSDWSKNMTKILSCSFKNWFGPFNMLIFSKCSDTWLSRHFSNRAFAAYSLTKKSPLRLILFLKVFTIWCSLKKRRKKLQKYFRFLEIYIWIGCVKQSLLLRQNTCDQVSIWWQKVSKFHILLRQNFSSWFFFRVIKKYNKNTALQI